MRFYSEIVAVLFFLLDSTNSVSPGRRMGNYEATGSSDDLSENDYYGIAENAQSNVNYVEKEKLELEEICNKAALAALDAFYDVYRRNAARRYEPLPAEPTEDDAEKDTDKAARMAFYTTYELYLTNWYKRLHKLREGKKQLFISQKSIKEDSPTEQKTKKLSSRQTSFEDLQNVEEEYANSLEKSGSPVVVMNLPQVEDLSIPEIEEELFEPERSGPENNQNHSADDRADIDNKDGSSKIVKTKKTSQYETNRVDPVRKAKELMLPKPVIAALKASQKYETEVVENHSNGVGAAARASTALREAADYANDDESATLAVLASDAYARAASHANDPDAVAAALQAGTEYADSVVKAANTVVDRVA